MRVRSFNAKLIKMYNEVFLGHQPCQVVELLDPADSPRKRNYTQLPGKMVTVAVSGVVRDDGQGWKRMHSWVHFHCILLLLKQKFIMHTEKQILIFQICSNKNLIIELL
jgi:hypothetical protein